MCSPWYPDWPVTGTPLVRLPPFRRPMRSCRPAILAQSQVGAQGKSTQEGGEDQPGWRI